MGKKLFMLIAFYQICSLAPNYDTSVGGGSWSTSHSTFSVTCGQVSLPTAPQI